MTEAESAVVPVRLVAQAVPDVPRQDSSQIDPPRMSRRTTPPAVASVVPASPNLVLPAAATATGKAAEEPSDAPSSAPVSAVPFGTSAEAVEPSTVPEPASTPTLPRSSADYLHNPQPAVPEMSRRLGEHGLVLLRVQVSAAGEALQVELHQSSGYTRLDVAAMNAVHRWRFVPARIGVEAVAAWVVVPIRFLASAA